MSLLFQRIVLLRFPANIGTMYKRGNCRPKYCLESDLNISAPVSFHMSGTNIISSSITAYARCTYLRPNRHTRAFSTSRKSFHLSCLEYFWLPNASCFEAGALWLASHSFCISYNITKFEHVHYRRRGIDTLCALVAGRVAGRTLHIV